MDSNPYSSPPEIPRENRHINLPQMILAISLTAVLMLIYFDAPRWLIVIVGASCALAAEELIKRD